MMASDIHINDLQHEGDSLYARIREYENRCQAYAAGCIQDIDQGQGADENKELLWRSIVDISGNMASSRASLQIAHGICKKLQERAVKEGVWE